MLAPVFPNIICTFYVGLNKLDKYSIQRNKSVDLLDFASVITCNTELKNIIIHKLE